MPMGYPKEQLSVCRTIAQTIYAKPHYSATAQSGKGLDLEILLGTSKGDRVTLQRSL